MKAKLLILCIFLAVGLCAKASVVIGGWSGSQTISDGNPVPTSYNFNAQGLYSSITELTISLNISGGYNGDLYAAVSHGGVLVPLMNRVGVSSASSFGYGDAGFSVVLSSASTRDLHFYMNDVGRTFSEGQLTGTWGADGRDVIPGASTPPSAYDNATRLTFDSYISNIEKPAAANPNGQWTLLFADLSSGSASTLTSWQLSVTEAPEPVNVALMVFGGAMGLVGLARNRKIRSLFQRA